MTRHETLREQVTLVGTLLTETGLHVGTGQPTAAADAGITRDFYRRPLIPGSSLKGALRSAVERRAEWLPGELRSCRLERDAPCLSTNDGMYDLHRLRQPEDEDAAGHYRRRMEELADPEKLCDTCRLFGSRVCGGKVQFDDLPLAQEFEAYGESLTEIRDGVGINRDAGTAEPSVKFDYEVVPSLTAFRFYATAENLDVRDWQLLALGLLELMNGNVPLGGKSTRGLGRCRLRLQEIWRVEFPAADREKAVENLLRHLRQPDAFRVPESPRDFLMRQVGLGPEGGNRAQAPR